MALVFGVVALAGPKAIASVLGVLGESDGDDPRSYTLELRL